jgi:hypothetical protein
MARPRNEFPIAAEATQILSPGMRVAAVICAAILLVASLGVPILVWYFARSSTSWGMWTAVAISCMVAAQCGRNLLRAARSGVGPKWIERDSL